MTDGAERYGKVVAEHGLSPTHLQVIDWVPRGSRVLELGCATGYIGRILMREKGCRVTGVEVDLAAAEVARANGLEVHTGSLEDEAFRTSLGTGYDIVIAADVLEHLANPAPVLEHFKRWLTPASASPGNLAPRGIVAVPNLATWSIRAQLFFRGDFEYQDTGILDRTHLHHFTWETFHKLVASQNWSIEDTMVDGWEVPGAHTLLFELPLSIMRRTRPTPTAGDRVAQYVASCAFKLGKLLSRPLVAHFPNLAAPHVALLLRPPA